MGASVVTRFVERYIKRIPEYHPLLMVIPDHGSNGFVKTKQHPHTELFLII